MKLIDLDFDDKADWIKITDLENVFRIYTENERYYKQYMISITSGQ